jgi:threonine synthase
VEADKSSGVWRFRSIVHPSARRVISWPEGNTPLLHRDRLCKYSGCDGLILKHEGMNPTGSFKDRGMTVAVTQAVRLQATAVGCASTGNTSASLAAYAALAGIPALVFVPEGQVALGKLTDPRRGAKTPGAATDARLTLARRRATASASPLLNSINPWRLEGQKTIVLEALLQLVDAPDWIALPPATWATLRPEGVWEAHDQLDRKNAEAASGAGRGAAPFTGLSRRSSLNVQGQGRDPGDRNQDRDPAPDRG